jgi:hypothetical protein
MKQSYSQYPFLQLIAIFPGAANPKRILIATMHAFSAILVIINETNFCILCEVFHRNVTSISGKELKLISTRVGEGSEYNLHIQAEKTKKKPT